MTKDEFIREIQKQNAFYRAWRIRMPHAVCVWEQASTNGYRFSAHCTKCGTTNTDIFFATDQKLVDLTPDRSRRRENMTIERLKRMGCFHLRDLLRGIPQDVAATAELELLAGDA